MPAKHGYACVADQTDITIEYQPGWALFSDLFLEDFDLPGKELCLRTISDFLIIRQNLFDFFAMSCESVSELFWEPSAAPAIVILQKKYVKAT